MAITPLPIAGVSTYFRMVDPHDKRLFVPEYQRELVPRRFPVGSEARQSLLLDATPLRLAERDDGRWAILDGQHTNHGAKGMGKRAQPALIICGLTLQQEAQLFIDINDFQRRLTAMAFFDAGTFAEDDITLQLRAVIEAAGCRVVKKLTKTSPYDCLQSVGNLRQAIVHDHCTAEEIQLALEVLMAAWPIDNLLTGYRMRGMAQFIHRHHPSWETLVTTLQAVGWDKVQRTYEKRRNQDKENMSRSFLLALEAEFYPVA